MLRRVLPDDASVNVWWAARLSAQVMVSIGGRSLTWGVGDDLLVSPSFASLWRLTSTAQAFCERALGAAERGPYW